MLDMNTSNSYTDDMAKRRKALENRVDHIKSYIYQNLLAIGAKSAGRILNATVQATSPTVVVADTSEVPEEFWTTPKPALKKKDLGKWLKTNEVDWACLQAGETVVIR